MFSKLKKSNDSYQVKLYMLRLISRMIGRHQIQLLAFYPNLLRYLNSHNKDKISEIFAMVIESCHELVPPETLRPVIERIISNFVTEYCNNAHITIGLNAIREILIRMPLALDPDQIEYLCLFKGSKNKSVRAAAKSLVNYFRDVCPELLPKKMRGRFATIDEDNEISTFVFGQQRLARDIDGIELLKRAEKIDPGTNLAAERVLDERDLKKIRILQLKEGVRHVDRHGFREDTEEREQKAADDRRDAAGSLKDEYYHKMVELIKLRQKNKKMQEAGEQESDSEEDSDMESGEDELDDEDGEMEGDEMEDGESDEEAGEEELISMEDDGEEVPEAVPIVDGIMVNNERTSEVSDIDVDDFPTSSEDDGYDSAELDVDTTANPHGFMYANMLETFSKARKDRLEELRAGKDKVAHREQFKKKKNTKKIGKSEKVHAKNKPFLMVKKKKIWESHDNLKTLNVKQRRDKNFLGHFRKSTQ